MKILIKLFVLVLISTNAIAGPYYQNGNISNLTAVQSGIMIKLDKGLPDNCEGASYGWMLAKQEHTALVSVILAAWMAGKKYGTVYTTGIDGSTGYCKIQQFDPTD